VWAQITALAAEPGVLDLGQGWPDFGASDVARDAAAAVIAADDDPRANQYSVISGRPELVTALKRYYEATGSKCAETSDVLVTSSGTEACYVAMRALLDPGDEVIFLEPFFPWYLSHAKLCGAVARPVRMKPTRSNSNSNSNSNDDTAAGPLRFALDEDALRRAFEEGRGKTKLFVHNSPHNPTGAVCSREDAALVARLCEEFDVAVLADEVYERCTFGVGGGGGGGGDDDTSGETAEVEPFHRMMDVVGMAERTITVGTSSKLLALTGWRVGWLAGPPSLIAACKTMHSYTTYCAPTPLQLGVAAALDVISEDAEGFVSADAAAAVMARNATLLAAALTDVGCVPIEPSGGYFLVCDVSSTGLTSVEYCAKLATEVKIAAVPLDVFYRRRDDGDGDGEDAAAAPPNNYVRFCVCKRRETIETCAAAIRANPVRK
jgi:aspartate/methionine/tyrosine aminotransferase